jgi:hypothetical protein
MFTEWTTFLSVVSTRFLQSPLQQCHANCIAPHISPQVTAPGSDGRCRTYWNGPIESSTTVPATTCFGTLEIKDSGPTGNVAREKNTVFVNDTLKVKLS